MKPLFTLKQYLKAWIQNRYLPQVYQKGCSMPVTKGKVLFADAHHNELTGNMKPVYQKLQEAGCTIEVFCRDFHEMSVGDTIVFMRRFMRAYAQAEFVFISSYFLPVSSCTKRKETTVVQLWHSGGLMKKMGYDTEEDIPKNYKGNPTANFDLVTVSAPVCERVWEQAFHLPQGRAAALGLARTDKYFDPEWNETNIQRFYEYYPEAKGKKICVYAPSFAGNAAHPYNRGIESGILDVMKNLIGEWFFVIKVHPSMEKDYPDCHCDLATDELFAAADLLITDYSSVLYDYLIYQKPFILYAPDLEEYRQKRGFYLEYESLPAPVLKSPNDLERALKEQDWLPYLSRLPEYRQKYMSACDGHAADRILTALGF